MKKQGHIWFMFQYPRWHADFQHTLASLVLIIARLITKYSIWFWFFLKLFLKFCFSKNQNSCPFSNVLYRPLNDLLAKSWAHSKILFLVQASKDPGVPELTSDQQANCCASCSYGTWHWIGVGGTIILILVAAISVITMIDHTVITNS